MPPDVGREVQPAWRVRWGAPALLMVSIALLQLGLAGARYPKQFTLHHLAWPMVLAALSMAGWWWHQRDAQTPLLYWYGLRHPGYLAGLGLYGLYYLIANAYGVVIPVFAEGALGLSNWQVGLLGSDGALVGWLTAGAYLRWGARANRKQALMAGAAAWMVLACFGLALTAVRHSGRAGLPVLMAAVAVKGAFGSLFVLPLAGLTFRELGEAQFGPGYQLENLLRHLMISTGMALAALGLASGAQGVDVLSRACAQLFCALGLASLLLGARVVLQRQLR